MLLPRSAAAARGADASSLTRPGRARACSLPGALLVSLLDGTLIALDSLTGAELWAEPFDTGKPLIRSVPAAPGAPLAAGEDPDAHASLGTGLGVVFPGLDGALYAYANGPEPGGGGGGGAAARKRGLQVRPAAPAGRPARAAFMARGGGRAWPRLGGPGRLRRLPPWRRACRRWEQLCCRSLMVHHRGGRLRTWRALPAALVRGWQPWPACLEPGVAWAAADAAAADRRHGGRRGAPSRVRNPKQGRAGAQRLAARVEDLARVGPEVALTDGSTVMSHNMTALVKGMDP